MKRLAVITILASGFAMACGSGGSSGPAPSSSSSGTTTFTIPLAASSEVPAVSNAEGNVSGTASIAIHTNKDGSGNVTSATADFQVTTAGFPAGSTITMAHIHRGGSSDGRGGIVVDTGLSAGGVPLSAGAGGFQKNGVNVPADIAQSLLSNPGGFYFNVHSSLNADGVARGQFGSGGSTSSGGDNSGGSGY